MASDKTFDEFNNFVLSTRRIFHIFADRTVDEMTNYKDLYFSSHGTGILLRYKSKFFLLTALHVLEHHLKESLPQNTSPFWITCKSLCSFSNSDDFLYPKCAWFIGDIIKEHDYYDFKDVVLVELFYPSTIQEIDHYIDLNKPQNILKQEDYKNGTVLTDIGFSEKSNPYFTEGDNERMPFDESIYTTSTVMKIDMIKGELRQNHFTHYFHKMQYSGENTNGMSGGLIVAVMPDSKVKLMGIHARGNPQSDQINFYPIDVVIDAVFRYEQAEMQEIDYCSYERIRKGEHLLSLGELFFNHVEKTDPSTLRSQADDPDALANDMADYFKANKTMLLDLATQRDSVIGDTSATDNFLTFMETIELYIENRDKKGED